MTTSPPELPNKERRRPGIYQAWRTAGGGPFEQAPPERLIALLSEILAGAVALLAHAIREGDAAVKAEQMVRVLAILHGLETSLDFKAGGAAAEKLAVAYRRLRRKIVKAAQENDPKRIEEARLVLADLVKMWRVL